MKIGWRLWLLGTVLLILVAFMFNLESSTSFLILGIGIGIIFALNSIKSKIGKSLIILLLLASMIFLIYTQVEVGVKIKSVDYNSTAYDAGLRAGQIIISLNGNSISSISDYSSAISQEFPSGENKQLTIQTKDNEFLLYTSQAPEITLEEISITRLKFGLDLQGGSRALIKAENKSLTYEEVEDLIAITENRFNVYGLSDMKIRNVRDLSNQNYMLIEIAGATPAELEELISKQGKFEAKIGNETVFVGGRDITHVERSGQYAGIEGCYASQEGEVCKFRFTISLNEEAAERHADITSKLEISQENPEYLSEKLDLYVDDSLMDSLFISKDLRGRPTTQILISGSGSGSNRREALEDADQSMKRLQTILITGSLPYKLEIVKLDTISPLLGKKFIRTILIAGLASLLAVAFIVLLRYRKIKLPLALLFTSFSEIFIIIGIAAVFNKIWTLDLPAIAGIIAVIGTGVDQQIVVLDESKSGISLSLKERLKRALFIILGSYATTMFAMFPLLAAGAGLLRGFAISTMIGITVGVLITRPAFAEIVKKIVD